MKTKTALPLLIMLFFAVATHAQTVPSGAVIDNTSILLNYSGTWSTTANASSYGGSYALSASGTDSVTLTTASDALTIYYDPQVGGGVVNVCNGAECGTFDSTTGTRATFGLGAGQISITGAVLALDAIYTDPLSVTSSPATPTPDPSVIYTTFEYGESDYTGAYRLELSAGDIASLLMLILISILLVVVLITTWFKGSTE